MKIAYLDLNDTHVEDYSVAPARYGGGAVFARWAKELLGDFHIFASEKAFENVVDLERKSHCHPLSDEARAKLRQGEFVLDYIPNADDYDLFVYHQVNLFLNLRGLRGKQCCWAVGLQEHVHPLIEDILLYNEFQRPIITNPNCRIHNVIIGKPIPEFASYRKDDYIFQCTRHTPIFGSIQVAQFCLDYGIRGTFAGPIDPGYPLLSYIDGKTTEYLGVIPEKEKLLRTQHARLYTMLHNWQTPFNLSAIEALAYGTPIACTPVGFWKSLIVNGENGFIVQNSRDLLTAWQSTALISQKKCWRSARPFSERLMVDSFESAFKNVLFKV